MLTTPPETRNAIAAPCDILLSIRPLARGGDTLVFLGDVNATRILNWDQAVDTVDVANAAAWTITRDIGTDTVLGHGVSDLTFAGITGLTDAADFLILARADNTFSPQRISTG